MIEHGERITNREQRERLSKSTFRHLLLHTLIKLESNLCEFNETCLTTLQMAIVIHKSTSSLTSTSTTDDHLSVKAKTARYCSSWSMTDYHLVSPVLFYDEC